MIELSLEDDETCEIPRRLERRIKHFLKGCEYLSLIDTLPNKLININLE